VTPLRQRMLEDLQIRPIHPPPSGFICTALPSSPSISVSHRTGSAPSIFGQYQLFLIKDTKVSRPTFVQVVCALRFFYTHTLNRKISIERIPFPRRERKLPLILSREEVKSLLAAPGSLRTRTLLAILYDCGLRVSEVAQLR